MSGRMAARRRVKMEARGSALSVACLVADAEKMLAMSGEPVTVDGIACLVQRWYSTAPYGDRRAGRNR